MERRIHHEPPTLPSNAPALTSTFGPHTSRVLQERSGNQQVDVYEQGFGGERKASCASSIENHYGRLSPVSLMSDTTASPVLGHRSEQRVEREFASLWRRLERSESYRKYRARQPRDAAERDQKWPEHMEVAFFRALVKYEPMGRRKQMLNGKLRGRNELIADEIEKVTREPRTRKQVSSHLQVLKTLLKDDPKIMRYMSKEDLQYRHSRHAVSGSSLSRRRPHQPPVLPSSTYHTLSVASHLPWQQDTLPSSRPQSPPAPLWSGNLVPTHFDMYVRDRDMNEIHEHTRFCNNAQGQDVFLEQLPNLQTYYPSLASLVTQSAPHPTVILMQVSLNIHFDPLPDQAEMCIREEFTADPNLSDFESFECRTQFLLNGTCTQTTEGEIKDYDRTIGRLSGTPFGSSFWASRFTELARKLRNGRDQPFRDTHRSAESEVSDILSRLSAVQEIIARSPARAPQTQRLLVVAWHFSLAPAGTPGQTSWHNVLLPSASDAALAAHMAGEFAPPPQSTTLPALSPSAPTSAADAFAPHHFDHLAAAPPGLDTLNSTVALADLAAAASTASNTSVTTPVDLSHLGASGASYPSLSIPLSGFAAHPSPTHSHSLPALDGLESLSSASVADDVGFDDGEAHQHGGDHLGGGGVGGQHHDGLGEKLAGYGAWMGGYEDVFGEHGGFVGGGEYTTAGEGGVWG